MRRAGRIAVIGADGAFAGRLRAHYGLAPSPRVLEAPRGLAYCGREFRIYPSMRIAEAARFYAALHDRWNAERLAADLAVATLRPDFEVRRMKRAFQRALVLAFACAAEPEILVIENGEEFDETPARRLLERAVAGVAFALVTYAGDAQADGSLFDEILRPDAFDLEPV